jgi:DNA (cytosine-5)-methyltransferase 1
MLETSEFLGTHRYQEPEDLQARVGYSDPPTHVSLFSGIGGFDLGFSQAGFKNLVAVEADQDAADTYRANLINDCENYGQDEPPVLMERDIRKVATWEILEAAGAGVGQITAISGVTDEWVDDDLGYVELMRTINLPSLTKALGGE